MESGNSALRVHALRLRPGMDLTSELKKYVKENQMSSAFIMTCCGSVTEATVRFAERIGEEGNQEIKKFHEHFEICSLVGTISALGSGCHLHVTLGRHDGSTISGHVVSDFKIFTTAEIVLGECSKLQFHRIFDQATGYPELVVSSTST